MFFMLCTNKIGYTNVRVSENQTYVETGKNVKIVVKIKALVRFRFIAFSTKRLLIEFIDLTSNYLSSYDFVPTVFLMYPSDQTKGNVFVITYRTLSLLT